MIYRMPVDGRGMVVIPAEVLKAIGVTGSAFVKMSAAGDSVVITKTPVQVISSSESK